MYEQFEALDTVVIAVAQEDTDLQKHAQFAGKFKPEPKFVLVADLNRKDTQAYDRVTTYLLDKEGVVRQILPQMLSKRASWEAALGEVIRLESK
jgi:peroxiredoxin